MRGIYLIRRTRPAYRGIPAPLPPGVSLINAGGLRAAFVKFQAMKEARRRTYTDNIRTAQGLNL